MSGGKSNRATRRDAQARLAQSVERQALNLMVVGSSPTVGVFIYQDTVSCTYEKKTATAAGFEPARAEPNGFLVHLLNHSDTLSYLLHPEMKNLMRYVAAGIF